MSTPQVPATAALTRGAWTTLVAELSPAAKLRDQLVALLHLDPAATNQAIVSMSTVALRMLPVGTLGTVEKSAYGRIDPSYVSALSSHVCDASQILQPLGVHIGPAPDKLGALPQRRSLYTSFRVFGTQVTNRGMDQRAVLAPMQVVLLDSALGHIHARFQDPTLSQEARDQLLDDFGPALVELDRVTSMPAERKDEIKGAKKTLEQELAEAQADAAYAETQLKLRQQLLVPREELIAAARRHQELKNKTPAAPTPGSPQLRPPGQRRIV